MDWRTEETKEKRNSHGKDATTVKENNQGGLLSYGRSAWKGGAKERW